MAQPWQRGALRALGSVIMPVSQQQEVQTGAQLDRTVRDHYPATENIALQEYVSAVGQKIASRTYKNYPFTYTVLADSRTANAFSGPGGFVYVTTGLINNLENESQLAAVLAHETAHIMRRHVTRQMQERSSADLAAVLLSRLAGGELDTRLTSLGRFVLLQRFSRDDEYEADWIGAQLMARAGYNPQGLVQVLDKLNALESRGVYISFLQSHPSSASRARLTNEYIRRHGLEQPGQILDTPRFHQVVE